MGTGQAVKRDGGSVGEAPLTASQAHNAVLCRRCGVREPVNGTPHCAPCLDALDFTAFHDRNRRANRARIDAIVVTLRRERGLL